MHSRSTIASMFRLAALLWLLLTGGVARAQTAVLLTEESRMWIEGRTNINAFSCEAKVIQGQGVLVSREVTLDRRTGLGASDALRRQVASLAVPVKGFDCGKDKMNADLYEALKAEQHPEILFELDSASVAAARDSLFTLAVSGRLRIAGVTQPISLRVLAWRDATGRFHASGFYPLNMRDYGIDPPRALMGLIKVRDQIAVRFDLVALPLIPPNDFTIEIRR